MEASTENTNVLRTPPPSPSLPLPLLQNIMALKEQREAKRHHKPHNLCHFGAQESLELRYTLRYLAILNDFQSKKLQFIFYFFVIFSLPDFKCAHVRMCVYGSYAPELGFGSSLVVGYGRPTYSPAFRLKSHPFKTFLFLF